MGAGKGKRVMGGGGPMSQTAQQAELKLEQMVDQRDMAIANASVNGDAAVETVTNQEILPISEVTPPGPPSCHAFMARSPMTALKQNSIDSSPH